MKERPIIMSGESVRAIIGGRKTMTRRLVKPQPNPDRFWRGVIVSSTCKADEGKHRFADGTGPLANTTGLVRCPYGGCGDRIWVREAWAECLAVSPATDEPVPVTNGDVLIEDPTYWIDAHGKQQWNYDGRVICYRATSAVVFCDGDGFSGDSANREDMPRWRSPMFMPRRASRLTLEVLSVRAERLQEITEEDAKAEGCECASDLAWGRGGFGPGSDPYEWAVKHGHRLDFEQRWDALNAKRAPWSSSPWVWVISFRRVEP